MSLNLLTSLEFMFVYGVKNSLNELKINVCICCLFIKLQESVVFWPRLQTWDVESSETNSRNNKLSDLAKPAITDFWSLNHPDQVINPTFILSVIVMLLCWTSCCYNISVFSELCLQPPILTFLIYKFWFLSFRYVLRYLPYLAGGAWQCLSVISQQLGLLHKYNNLAKLCSGVQTPEDSALNLQVGQQHSWAHPSDYTSL